MKQKTLIIALILVVVLAAATALAGVAFGWWTSDPAVGGNTLTSDTATLVVGGAPIALNGLVPQVDPAADPTGSLPDSTYPSVSYIYVQNQGSVPLMFYVFLADPSGYVGLVDYVHVRIWLNPATNNSGWTNTFNNTGNYQVFNGMLGTIWNSSAQGKVYLGSTSGLNGSGVKTPINPGETGVYKIAVWLDQTAGNDTQGKTVGFSINLHGEQVEQFDAAGGW
jgi:hypothetical protein